MKKFNLTTKAALIFLFFSIIGFSIFVESSYAQFGKNKVQYKEFDWKYIQTDHFDIYFNQGGQYIAEFTAIAAESSLVSLSKNLNYNISNRVPIIVFNSHNEFQQNNVIDEYLPEGVGGVTELFKNRIVVPFEGKYEALRHVIHHELLHAFMNDMFYGGSLQNIVSKNITLIFPTWFNEGMAESQSLYGMDKENDMYMRDLVMNNYLPPIEYCGGYLAYRAGQSFFSFLADYYGEDKIGELLNNIKGMGDLYGGFQETFKLSVEELSEKWQKELKKTYWPEINTREDVTDIAKMLTDHTEDGGFYNVSPTISPKGDVFAFISNRDDLFDVFLANANTGEIIEKVIEGNMTSNFEELQVLTPGLSWSHDGRKLAISVKAGDKDAIFIINIKTGDKRQLPIELNSISSVSWSPVSSKLTFVGTNPKQSDIYTYDISLGILENLTKDIFSDFTPKWSPDGKYVYFTSDRGNYIDRNMIPPDFKMFNYDHSGKDIYRIDVESKKIKRETDIKDSKQNYVQFSPDGKKMLYVSDVNGISNIYLRETDTSGVTIDRPITNSLNPIDQISLSKDGKKLLFVSLNKGGYDIFSMVNPFNRNLEVDVLEPTEFVEERFELESKFGKVTITDKENINTNDSLLSDSDSLFFNDTLSFVKNDSLNIPDSLKMSDVLESKDTLDFYGNDIKISFHKNKNDKPKNKPNLDSLYDNNENFNISNNTNSDGSFKIKNYKVKFSPDLVYGNANYSSFYGVQGVAQISLSDMLGNHRIYILTSMVIDLKNSDYAIGYFYLPKRIDYGFELFHTARFVYYDEDFGGDQLYRYRTFGGNIIASYPFTKFKRVDADITVMHISQENLDNSSMPIERKTFVVPSMSFVHDNTLWGYTSPIKGTRYNITGMASPMLGKKGMGFTALLGDFRTYFKIADNYSFAMRFAGGASFGPTPIRFYIGGTENWINWDYEHYNIPISNINEYAFSTPGLPLRGFNYDRLYGSKYALTNFELRFPLFKYLIFGALPLGFQNIQGVAFVDAGTAFSDNKSLKLFTRENGYFETKDLLLGMGFGTRIVLLNIPFKFDVAWNYNMHKFSKPKYYFSLGLDF